MPDSKKWYYKLGGNDDVAVSTRVRLARNLPGAPFSGRIDKDQKEEVLALAERAISETLPDMRIEDMGRCGGIHAAALVEKHLISPDLASGGPACAVALSQDESLSIMINEEDHLRIQCIKAGLQLEEAFSQASDADDLLCEKLSFAYDSKLGYLTHCLTNLGTGMRASVMLHLPALCEAGEINALIASANKIGVAVRGSFGEGTSATGCMFQISNQITLGLSEGQIIDKIKAVVMQIIEREKIQRKNLMLSGGAIQDRIWRSYGILSYARQMSTAEFMQHISGVRLGVAEGVIEGIGLETVNSLILSAGPGCIAEQYGTAVTKSQRDEARAGLLRLALGRAQDKKE